MHTDLQRLYCELGAEQSYGKSARILAAFSSGKRAINNHQRLHKTAQTVAEAVAKQEKEKLKKPASTLVAQVDGGYVHDWEQRGHNYEVMVGKIYKPESIKTKGKNRTQIVNKQCAASAKKDKQATMKQRFLSAAFSEGLTMETAVTALSDGAKNCWCILRELEKHCLSVTYILDWFHIGKKLKTLENCLPADNKKPLAEIKKALWKGKTEAALWQLKQTKSRLVEETDIARLNDFHDYIARNKKYVVNYNERHHAHLPYTTHVVESTIEHLLNARCRKKQKMQWSRRGIDNVLQLRVAIVNQQWPSVWNTFIENHYKLAA
jgi:CRISPR/Cas system-associated exonuclease Cas4 (RecB family)